MKTVEEKMHLNTQASLLKIRALKTVKSSVNFNLLFVYYRQVTAC